MTHLCQHVAAPPATRLAPAHGWKLAVSTTAEFRQVLPGLMFQDPRQNGMLAFYLRTDDATAAAR
jgi:hypothetical protein